MSGNHPRSVKHWLSLAAAGTLLAAGAFVTLPIAAAEAPTPGPSMAHPTVTKSKTPEQLLVEGIQRQRSINDHAELEARLAAERAQLEEAQRQAAAAAAAKARAAEHVAQRPHTGGVNWDAIARCETGGNWRMQGSTYSGGLGFYNGTWDGFGGREFASNAGLASREQQIIVAERVYAKYGLSGWGCRRFG